jgi:hypothetical protein
MKFNSEISELLTAYRKRSSSIGAVIKAMTTIRETVSPFSGRIG